MAEVNSGRAYSEYGRNSRVYVDWLIVETDSANNRWKIDWEAGIVVEKGDEWYSNAVKINSIYIDGGDSLGSGVYSNIIGTGTYQKLSGSKWISANSDGSKSLTVSINGWFYSYGNVSGGDTFTLPTIPRQATLLTATNFSDEDNPTITYSNPAGTAVSALDACISFDGTNDHIAYRAVLKTGSSYTFTLTDAEKETLRAACQDSNTLSVQFYLRTKIGNNTYYSHLIRTFSINNANPIITASVEDTNQATINLTGDSRKLIKYYSNAHATMSVEAQKGATFDESLCVIRNGSNANYGLSLAVVSVDSNIFNFSATDSRGNVGYATVTAEMIEYIKPTCNIANNRPDALGNMEVACSGIFFNSSFGAVSNTLKAQYRYKVVGGAFGDWTPMTVTKNENSYYASASLSGLDYKLTYSFEIRVSDQLSSVTIISPAVKGTPIFHWGENDFVFEVPVLFKAGAEGVVDEEDVYAGTLLWSGSYYMTADQTATLSELVSKQRNGIVLVFSEFGNGTAYDQTFHCRFIPKMIVALKSGSGHCIQLNSSNLAYFATKYLYITDEKITGHNNNSLTGTGDCGITFTNDRFVLRYVIGV